MTDMLGESSLGQGVKHLNPTLTVFTQGSPTASARRLRSPSLNMDSSL